MNTSTSPAPPADDAAARPPATPPPERAAGLFEEAAAETGGRERPAPPPPEEIAPLFPDLEIQGVLGVGGMGIVYRARHKRLDRLVALKILPQALAQDPQFVERFEREARALARLDHPRIVRVHDVGQTAGYCYLVLEFVDGANLRQVMAAGRLSPAEALAIVPQICEALQYAHDQGVVHRDIKPENVLLDAKGRVKIADFGLAKLVDRPAGATGLTATGQVMGTFQYMAPEQVKTPQDVDHRADLYSLGVVFYEMLTGELPMGRFEPPSRASGLDARIDRIVMHALERAREQRYQKAEEIKTDVAGLAAPPAAQAGSAADAAPTPRRGRSDAQVLIALAALLLGWLVFALVHAAWGSVTRGTDEAMAREMWKGIAAAVVFVAGALVGTAAAVRGASAPHPRRMHKLGVTLALLNVAALLALLVAVANEVQTHSQDKRARESLILHLGRHPTATLFPVSPEMREMHAVLARILERLRKEGATPEVIQREYVPGGTYPVAMHDYTAREDLGMGPYLLRMTEAERERLQLIGVEELALGLRRMTVELDGRYTWEFTMSRHEGTWVLTLDHVEHHVGPR